MTRFVSDGWRREVDEGHSGLRGTMGIFNSKKGKGKQTRRPPRGEVTAKDRAELELKVARDKIRP